MIEFTVYIAGKVTGVEDLNKPKFEAATRQLRDMGFLVKNPHEICSGRHPNDWNGCMKDCIKVLVDADLVIMLDDWLDSKGAQIEVVLARNLGIQCIELKSFFDDFYPDFKKTFDLRKNENRPDNF